jgi:nucleotide-binding universal stress UspA family protein
MIMAGPETRRRRRSYEHGHKPKFLVVLDDTAECDRAVYFASRRARRIGAEVLMLYVIDPVYAKQEWLGVAEIMRAEAFDQAQVLVEKYVSRAAKICGPVCPYVIREGDKVKELLKLIDEDDDIAVLVLAAGSTPEGPGPLVSELARTAGSYPIPVVIVPEHLTDEEIDALS